MNKKVVIILIIISTFAVTASGFWYVKDQNGGDVISENVNTSQKDEDIDTSNWKTYHNEEYGFEFKYPNNLELVFQNKFDSYGTATIIFYNSFYYEDISNSVNPMLAIIDENIDYLLLDIIGYDYVRASDFNIKEYIVPSLFSHDKGIDISQRILEWNNIVSEDGKTNINLYVTETIDEQIKTKGAIWISNGKLFNIKMVGGGDIYKNISMTFQ